MDGAVVGCFGCECSEKHQITEVVVSICKREEKKEEEGRGWSIPLVCTAKTQCARDVLCALFSFYLALGYIC